MRQRSIRLLPTLPDPASMSAASTLIDRFAGRDNHATCLRYLVPEEVRQSPSPGIMLADTSLNKDVLPRLTPDGGSIWHVIWVQDEANTTATVETVSGTSTWPIAPGDSLRVPAGANLRPTGGQLGILISRSGQETSTELPPPTHGIDELHGHNRLTTYPMLGGIATPRWKITQPLDLSLHGGAPVIVVSLAGDPAIASPNESLTLRRGQAVIANTDRPITIYPAGLGYVYTITW